MTALKEKERFEVRGMTTLILVFEKPNGVINSTPVS